jgi:hypothetical protein
VGNRHTVLWSRPPRPPDAMPAAALGCQLLLQRLLTHTCRSCVVLEQRCLRYSSSGARPKGGGASTASRGVPPGGKKVQATYLDRIKRLAVQNLDGEVAGRVAISAEQLKRVHSPAGSPLDCASLQFARSWTCRYRNAFFYHFRTSNIGQNSKATCHTRTLRWVPWNRGMGEGAKEYRPYVTQAAPCT